MFKKNPTWDVEDSAWKATQILKIIGSNKIYAHSICEVGCGAGEILHQLYLNMDDDIDFVGYEISPAAYELCQQRKSERVTYKLANIVDDSTDFFDILMAIDVIEHVEDVFGFLRALKGKGNYKIFHIPLSMNVSAVLRMTPILTEWDQFGHIHYFTKETALRTLKDTGYEILDYFFTSGALDFPSKSFGAHMLRLPRRIGFKISPDLTERIFGGFSLMVLTK